MLLGQQYDAIVPAPFGAVGISTEGEVITGIDFLPPRFAAKLPMKPPPNPLAAKAAKQIVQYMSQPDFRFDLRLAESGTVFQRKVWQQIAAIPSGKVATYGQIAKLVHSAPRAVGGACGANPFPLITPCHRVLTSTGSLGGFSGRSDDTEFLLRVKRWLLTHEGVEVHP